jgi:hypothetical protein
MDPEGNTHLNQAYSKGRTGFAHSESPHKNDHFHSFHGSAQERKRVNLQLRGL